MRGMKTFAGLLRCFSELELSAKRPLWVTSLRFSRAAQVKVNESLETKKRVEVPCDLAALEEEIVQCVGYEQT